MGIPFVWWRRAEWAIPSSKAYGTQTLLLLRDGRPAVNIEELNPLENGLAEIPDHFRNLLCFQTLVHDEGKIPVHGRKSG